MQALRNIRRQAIVVQALKEKLAELQTATISAAKISRQLCASGGTRSGIERILIQKEEIEAALKKEEKILQKMELEAREELTLFKGGAYSFCVYYYLHGMSVEETAGVMNRSIRQVMRYKKEAEEAGK